MTQHEPMQFSDAAPTDPSRDGIDGLPRCICCLLSLSSTLLEESGIWSGRYLQAVGLASFLNDV